MADSNSELPAIELRGLTKFYGRVRGVEDVDLTVRRREVFGFLGPNGAGKTTTIRLIMGFLRPTRGAGTVLGHDIVRHSTTLRRLVGFAPGGATPYEQLTGREVLDYLSGLQGAPSRLRGELCERLDLSSRDLARPLRQYSKGMRQKVALVQAIQHDPPLLILDEPTEGLDPLMQNELFTILAERQQAGATVFMSSHILSEVERLCPRVAIIRDGRLVAVEEMAQLRGRRGSRVTVRLGLNSSAVRVPALSGVSMVQRNGDVVSFLYQGEPARLLQMLAQVAPEEVSIEQPSLEEVFMGFYQKPQGEPALDTPARPAA